MDETWRALSREAGLAAEHIAFGATVLGRANYATTAYYSQAFFALSTGLERSCKLALLINYALENGGSFPDDAAVRGYGHNLEGLIAAAAEIAQHRGYEVRRPDSAIHQGIVETLSEFAMNVTRYYNIDVLTGESRARGRDDPIASWYEKVTLPVLEIHYTDAIRCRHETNAQIVGSLLDDMSSFRYTSEAGAIIDSAAQGSINTARAEFARRWERMYVLQFGRFVGSILTKLADEAHVQQLSVPFLDEFYSIFSLSDVDFRTRKTWSIFPF